jgi:hypothetical protein
VPARKEALTFDRHDMASTKRSDASLSTFNSNLHIEWAPCRRLSNQVASAGQHGAPGRSSPDQMCALDGRGLTLGQTLTSTPPPIRQNHCETGEWGFLVLKRRRPLKPISVFG